MRLPILVALATFITMSGWSLGLANAFALEPSTLGGIAVSAGRLSNTIKVRFCIIIFINILPRMCGQFFEPNVIIVYTMLSCSGRI